MKELSKQEIEHYRDRIESSGWNWTGDVIDAISYDLDFNNVNIIKNKTWLFEVWSGYCEEDHCYYSTFTNKIYHPSVLFTNNFTPKCFCNLRNDLTNFFYEFSSTEEKIAIMTVLSDDKDEKIAQLFDECLYALYQLNKTNPSRISILENKMIEFNEKDLDGTLFIK